MSLASDIVAALSANATLTGLVADRIRPDMADEADASPYVVFEEISSDPANGLDGHHGKTLSRVQITAWAATFEVARQCADAILAAMKTANSGGTLKNTWQERRDQPFDIATRTFGIEQTFTCWQTT